MTDSAGKLIEFVPFVVDETPFCAAGTEVVQRNKSFVAGLEPGYYEFMASLFGQEQPEKIRHYAAVTIRAAYGQGLESLFALLFASLQAPSCVAAWLAEYRRRDLVSLIGKVESGKPILSRVPVREVSWRGVAQAAFELPEVESERERFLAGFSLVLARLARDQLDEEDYREYNSLKHGLRFRPGGFSLKIGELDLQGETTGSLYFESRRIKGAPEHYRQLVMNWANWPNEVLGRNLHLLSLCMQNLKAALMVRLGIEDSEPPKGVIPKEDWYFDEPQRSSPVKRIRLDEGNVTEVPDRFTAEEILAGYKRQNES